MEENEYLVNGRRLEIVMPLSSIYLLVPEKTSEPENSAGQFFPQTLF